MDDGGVLMVCLCVVRLPVGSQMRAQMDGREADGGGDCFAGGGLSCFSSPADDGYWLTQFASAGGDETDFFPNIHSSQPLTDIGRSVRFSSGETDGLT